MKARRRFARVGMLVVTAAAVALAVSASARAAAWPERTVTIVVPFPAGGPIDQIARQLAQHLQQTSGKPVVVDNRSGAGGTIASQQVARAAPDGYTLLLATSSSQITVPQTMKKPPYDGVTDFSPIATLVRYPFLLVGKANGAASVQALVAAGHDRELSYGSFGIGTGNHLVASYFAQSTGLRALNIPYRGSGATSAALIAGEIDFVFDSIQAVSGLIATGKIRPLAVSSRDRASALPNVPTLQECGLAGFDEVIWVGLLGPQGLPAEVAGRINAVVSDFLKKDAAFRNRLQAQGATVTGGSQDDFRALLKSDQQRWSRFIAAHHIRID